MLLALPVLARAASPIPVVAAENMYGDVASQIGGAQVSVTSILSSPDQDPHLFEVTPSAARIVSRARLVISNGAGYDPWMDRLLRAAPNPARRTIVVATLAGARPGDNPHLWYDTAVMLKAAKAVATELTAIDPEHKQQYQQHLAAFQHAMQPVQAKIATLRKHLAGTPVTATEPVFGYMLHALGMQVRNQRFQRSVMNDTEPSASDVAAVQNDLRDHRVRLLVYNTQTSGPMARRMRRLAQKAGIPVLGVTETEPPGMTYQAWMLHDLNALERALAQ